MARWEIEKVGAAHLLEALKVVLDHLRDFTIGGKAPEMSASRNASATYAQVRRLRTYLQRCVSAYSDVVELDLNEDDQNLLAACAIFEVANLERRLNGVPRAGDDMSWLEERRRALSHWGVTFATRRIDPIPVADESLFLTTGVQTLLREIQRRVVAEGQRSGVHRVTREMAGVPTIPSVPAPPPVQAAPASVYQPRATQPIPPHAAPPGYVDPAWAAQQPAPTAQGYEHHNGAYPPPHDPRVAAPAQHYVAPVEEQRRAPAVSREFGIPKPMQGMPGAPATATVRPAVPVPPAPPAPRSGYVDPVQQPATAARSPSAPASTEDQPADQPGPAFDLDARKLHDPRVRALLVLDLRAFERAFRANDHRLCVLHLGSILEAACIDYALSHRRELALNGAPETWNLEVVVRRVLGDEISSMDRALLFHLGAARNLLRPAIQLSNPMVVTAATQGELTQFVRRVLTAMGYMSMGEPSLSPGVQAATPAMASAHAPTMPAAPPPRPSNPGLPGWLRST